MNNENPLFTRVSLLIGDDALDCIEDKKVILFGVGGVGSWCAEALVRSGIGHITIVDNDVVDVSNINRQLPATTQTIGMPKVEVMKTRLESINPKAQVCAIRAFYDDSTADDFDLSRYDYVIDAIDSLSSKELLIRRATATRNTTLFSSMGAALKTDPSRINVAEFWKVKGCPLARALRQRFKKSGKMPRRKFYCVYSDELVANKKESQDASGKKINGALVHITAIFGFTLASLVVRHCIKMS